MTARIELIRDEERLLELRPQWDALWLRSERLPFSHFDWVWMVWQRRKLRRPDGLYVLALFEQDQLLAALPMLVGYRLPFVFAANGLDPPLGNFQELLSGTDAKQHDLAAQVFARLRHARGLFRLKFYSVRDGSPILTASAPYVKSKRVWTEETGADLSGGFAAYYATRSGQLQVAQRRNIRRLERLGPVTFSTSDRHSIDADLDWLLERKRQWEPPSGKLHAWLTSQESENDVRHLCHEWMARGWVWLTTLRVGPTRVATALTWVTGPTAIYFVLTYDPAFAYYSPGLMLSIMLHEKLAAAGVMRLSYMGSVFPWKERLATYRSPIHRLRLFG